MPWREVETVCRQRSYKSVFFNQRGRGTLAEILFVD